jgi:hypothetical protein
METTVPPRTRLDRLQGVWFLTHLSQNGRLTAVHEPVWPAPSGAWLMTIQGDTFHVTSNTDYYATGGWVRLGDEPGRMTLAYPGMPAEIHGRFAFQLEEDELHMQSGSLPWSRRSDWVSAARYVRVAPLPTDPMAALIKAMMQGPYWVEPGC